MTTTRRRRVLSTVVLIPAIALVLSGCTFGFSPDGPPTSGDDTPPSTSSEPADTPTDDAGDEDADILTRDNISARTTQQVTCGGADLEIADIGLVVEVTDDCARLVVSGHGSVVLAASVDDLDVSGVGAVVFAAEIDTVRVTGDGSVVLWESGSPSVDDESVGSVLLPAGSQR